MLELLILYILSEGKCSIYGIKQKIERLFSLFLKPSFGSIHPALKKLESNKMITVKSQLSSGGQRKSTYSLTDSGRTHFKNLMLTDLPENPAIAFQIINIKLMALLKLDTNDQRLVVRSLLQYLNYQKAAAHNLLNIEEIAENKSRQKIIKHNIEKISEDIKLINSLIETN